VASPCLVVLDQIVVHQLEHDVAFALKSIVTARIGEKSKLKI
jgi:hypothetical protein